MSTTLKTILTAIIKYTLLLAIVGGIATGLYFTRDHWWGYVFPSPKVAKEEEDDHDHGEEEEVKLKLSDQAKKNLKLISKPLKAETYWRTISVPGVLTDRPGYGDRGLVAPATSIISRIHRVAGESANPGEPLFTVKLLSETLHQTQADLFKATQDSKLAEEQKKRLTQSGGAVAEARVIEVENQISRLQVAIKAYRLELSNRGFTTEQLTSITEGQFVTEMTIRAPELPPRPKGSEVSPSQATPYEVQEIKVDLGQQVQAGQSLCVLSNHQLLVIEGRAFRDESPKIERAMQAGWPVEVDFAEADSSDWPPMNSTFGIVTLANTIDPESNTFAFLLPLENQTRELNRDGRLQRLWRFRPGQRVRLRVPVESVPNVFILPADAVVREGAEAFVFRQNGELFIRKPVQVIEQSRDRVVIANDGTLSPGHYVAQSAALQLNRMQKAQSGTAPAGFHIHADGSIHQNHK